MDNLFFILSKIFWLVAKPESWFALLMLLALLALFRRKSGLATALLTVQFLFHVSLAIFPVGDLFLSPLETRFPVRPSISSPAYVIVLGGGEDIEQSQATGMVNINSAGDRLLAAIELAVAYPEAKLILSGDTGQISGSTLSSAEIMAEALRAAGIDGNRLLVEADSRNTAESGRLIAGLVVGDGLSAASVLVTSAYHMSRSLGVFCAAGWSDLTPYPVDHRSGNSRGRIGWNFARNLRDLNAGVREWIGLLAYRLTGRTTRMLPSSCLD